MDYTTFAVEQIKQLVKVPSPTGMTEKAAKYIADTLKKLGFEPKTSKKGTVMVCLGGQGHPLLLSAHVDTLGAMVRAIKGNGALRYMKVGGFSDNAIENENCLIHATNGKVYSGTIRPVKASQHVFGNTSDVVRSDETLEVTLDECVYSAEDVAALGIEVGDFISFDPRLVVTESGFIKSRHLDDKASSGILLALAKAVKDGAVTLSRKVYLMFTVFEEVGHGASALVADDIEDMLAVDMGCVGGDLSCKETQVSICIKDSAGPFHREWTKEICLMADEAGIDYQKDVYPSYSSDTAAALEAGREVRHALIGPGVYASHAYERTHIKAVDNTLRLLMRVCGEKE